MKGAKGLLISITGGRDLTLFEVDEAATRIREEVDQDANIILGATFDEELEGVIRVSVVATGIDKTAAEIAAAPIAIRQPPRQAGQPPAAAGDARRPRAGRPGSAACRSRAPPIRSPKPSGWPRSTPPRSAQPVRRRQPQADDFRPHSKLFQAPPAQPQPQQVQPRAAAPRRSARASQPAAAQPRMPRVEDFPPVVKAEVEAKSRPADQEDSGPMGLLKRLTNGLTRREEEPARLQPAQPREPKLRQPAPEARRLAQPGPAALRAAPRPARRARPPGAAGSARRRKTTSWRFRRSCAARRTERVEPACNSVTGRR